MGEPLTNFGGQLTSQQDLCLKGRWTSTGTARIYMCDGLAQLSELKLTVQKMRQIRTLALRARPDFGV